MQRAVPSLRLIMEAPPFWIYWIYFSIFSSREPTAGSSPCFLRAHQPLGSLLLLLLWFYYVVSTNAVRAVRENHVGQTGKKQTRCWFIILEIF